MGRAFRQSWKAVKPAEGQTFRPESPAHWMPQPYLSYPLERIDQLYWSATQSQAMDWCWECANCHRTIDASAFRRCQRARVNVMESGDFAANCLHCGKRRKWFLDDARPCRVRRQFSMAFRKGFCDAVAVGM